MNFGNLKMYVGGELINATNNNEKIFFALLITNLLLNYRGLMKLMLKKLLYLQRKVLNIGLNYLMMKEKNGCIN